MMGFGFPRRRGYSIVVDRFMYGCDVRMAYLCCVENYFASLPMQSQNGLWALAEPSRYLEPA